MAGGRTLTIYLDANTKGAEAGLGKVDASLSKLAKTAAGFVSAGVALDWLRQSVVAAAESETSTLKLNAAFEKLPQLAGASATAMQGYVAALSAKTGQDDEALATGATLLAQFGATATEIEALLPLVDDYATYMGKDVPDAATTVGKALIGNARALKALGIDFQATGDRAADMATIQQLLNEKVGGFSEAFSETAAGRLRTLATEYGNLQEAIGTALLPALDAGVPIVQEWGRQFDSLIGPVNDVAEGLNDLADSIGVSQGDRESLAQWLPSAAAGFGTLGLALNANKYLFQLLGIDIGGAADAAAGALPPFEDLADMATESAASFRDYRDAVISWKEAQADARTKADELTGATNKQGTAFRTNTAAGREAETAMLDLAQAGEEAWRAAADEGRAGAAQRILTETRAQLVQTGIRFGLTKKDAGDYADKILDIPDKATTDAVFDSAQAEADIARFKRLVQGASGSVTVPIVTTRSGLPSPPAATFTAARGATSAAARVDIPAATIVIQAGVGDPVAIAREVERVLASRRLRLGIT